MELNGVLINEHEIANVQDGKKYRIVKKEDINRIVLTYGFVAASPVIQTVFGAGIALAGLYFLKNIIRWITCGGTIHAAQLWMAITVLVGVWVIYDGLKKGCYLAVATKNKTEKITFAKVKDTKAVSEFVEKAKAAYGYEIQSNII